MISGGFEDNHGITKGANSRSEAPFQRCYIKSNGSKIDSMLTVRFRCPAASFIDYAARCTRLNARQAQDSVQCLSLDYREVYAPKVNLLMEKAMGEKGVDLALCNTKMVAKAPHFGRPRFHRIQGKMSVADNGQEVENYLLQCALIVLG